MEEGSDLKKWGRNEGVCKGEVRRKRATRREGERGVDVVGKVGRLGEEGIGKDCVGGEAGT